LGASKQAHQRLIGFALETHDEHANAERKLQTKNLDMIVLNSLQDKGAGFGLDTNKVTLLYANGTKKDLPLLLKQEVADTIIDSI
jgi:phosphopantothenoylcysteine decarboxylase/phosphopantothenate--cysteine ligase